MNKAKSASMKALQKKVKPQDIDLKEAYRILAKAYFRNHPYHTQNEAIVTLKGAK